MLFGVVMFYSKAMTIPAKVAKSHTTTNKLSRRDFIHCEAGAGASGGVGAFRKGRLSS